MTVLNEILVPLKLKFSFFRYFYFWHKINMKKKGVENAIKRVMTVNQ